MTYIHHDEAAVIAAIKRLLPDAMVEDAGDGTMLVHTGLHWIGDEGENLAGAINLPTEATEADAPVWYSAEAASAWAAGRNSV